MDEDEDAEADHDQAGRPVCGGVNDGVLAAQEGHRPVVNAVYKRFGARYAPGRHCGPFRDGCVGGHSRSCHNVQDHVAYYYRKGAPEPDGVFERRENFKKLLIGERWSDCCRIQRCKKIECI